ncbi:maleylpyruvate isomerase N-terminal domain-containing protein [Micromonospora sp. Llam0]|uniref:maleylpyruvate isomerase N-terminal domain-containing protein n=1 Tax=Micromonospora sp. Llam0 TaxID=2485143 RepID=UPI000F479995|nr:maleylpyruvate isomerase N-terminal domain-containing protein [Micromonospora sp. Llam0]
MDYRQTYESAASTFAELIHRVPADRWAAPGLGEWSCADLVGHTVSSALRQVPEVLATAGQTGAPATGQAPAPATVPPIGVDSPEDYWALPRSVPAELLAAAVAASSVDARRTGQLLFARGPAADAAAAPTADTADAVVDDWVRQATAALAAVADDDVVHTRVGGIRVDVWLPTRTFELVVHGLDVAAATGVSVEFAAPALAETAAQAARVAVAVGDGPLVLQALTGRGSLPPGFSVV